MKFAKSFQTVDTQVVGQAFRIVTQSPILIHSNTIEEASSYLEQNYTDTKNILLNEPRGHRGMNGCIILPSSVADFRLLLFQHKASVEFKYEAIIATVTALVEQQIIQLDSEQNVTVETIEGIKLVQVQLSEDQNEVESVKMKVSKAKVENYIAIVDQKRRYAIVEHPASIKEMTLTHLSSISTWGMEQSVQISDVDAVIMYKKLNGKVRTVTFEKDGYILRSPGIDTTIAMAAFLGNLEQLENESIFGTSIKISANLNDGYELALTSNITGIHQFVVDQEDPLQGGFVIV